MMDYLLALLGLTFFIVITSAVLLIYPIIFPRIVEFPWNIPSKKDPRTVTLAGSYNPPHLGHIAMLQHLAKRHERVVAIVGFNPNKKYAVSPTQRVDLLKSMLKETSSDASITVKLVDGYIWRYAKANNISLFYRGIRSWEKDGGDERALQILNTWGPMCLGPLVWPIPTHYLEGDPKYNHISSTLIRTICSKNDGDQKQRQKELSKLVPEGVTSTIAQFYGGKQD